MVLELLTKPLFDFRLDGAQYSQILKHCNAVLGDECGGLCDGQWKIDQITNQLRITGHVTCIVFDLRRLWQEQRFSVIHIHEGTNMGSSLSDNL